MSKNYYWMRPPGGGGSSQKIFYYSLPVTFAHSVTSTASDSDGTDLNSQVGSDIYFSADKKCLDADLSKLVDPMYMSFDKYTWDINADRRHLTDFPTDINGSVSLSVKFFNQNDVEIANYGLGYYTASTQYSTLRGYAYSDLYPGNIQLYPGVTGGGQFIKYLKIWSYYNSVTGWSTTFTGNFVFQYKA